MVSERVKESSDKAHPSKRSKSAAQSSTTSTQGGKAEAVNTSSNSMLHPKRSILSKKISLLVLVNAGTQKKLMFAKCQKSVEIEDEDSGYQGTAPRNPKHIIESSDDNDEDEPEIVIIDKENDAGEGSSSAAWKKGKKTEETAEEEVRRAEKSGDFSIQVIDSLAADANSQHWGVIYCDVNDIRDAQSCKERGQDGLKCKS